jgi:hypothetical protein
VASSPFCWRRRMSVADDFVNGHVRLAECDTHRLPASGQGFVQALLSIEVIRDQLPVNPSSVGDRTNPRPA